MSVPNVLTQDLDAILNAFESEDFTMMNILSNRFMSNSIFYEEENTFLPGFISKDIALTFGRLKAQSSDVFSTAKADISPVLEKVMSYYIDASKNSSDLWAVYLEYFLKIRDYTIKDFEKSAYKVDYDFTRLTFQWLMQFLDENKELLRHNKNRLLKGVLNEMDRVIRCHLGRIEDVVAISLVRSLEFVYGYIIYEGSDTERDKIYPFLDRVLVLLSAEKIDLNESLNVLNNILLEWRKYFIKFMEVSVTREYTLEKGIELPDDIKEKLSESIFKTLDEEIKRE